MEGMKRLIKFSFYFFYIFLFFLLHVLWSEEKKTEILYYTCTMHPSVKSKTPGKCPICSMDLIPVYSTSLETPSAEKIQKEPSQTTPFFIPPERLQTIGIRTEEVTVLPLKAEIKAPAIVSINESQVYDINVKGGNGYVIKLYANYVGKHFSKGEVLATILSQDWVQAQMDYVKAYRAWRRSLLVKKDNPILLDQQFYHVRARLRVWDLDEEQIKELEKRAWAMSVTDVRTAKGIRGSFDLHSPVEGHVHEKNIYEGMYFTAGQSLLRIVDLRTVWILAELPEDQSRYITVGLPCEITFPAYPGRIFRSKIDFIQPHFEEETRRLQLRVVLPNLNHMFHPGMYADFKTIIDFGKKLAIAEDAVIPTGEKFVVFLDHGGGHLEPRFVDLGEKIEGYYIVRGGLKEGDQVVSGANFLIDAEARVQGALKIWTRENMKTTPEQNKAHPPMEHNPMHGMPGHMHGMPGM
ncbi:efflux transporter periplasmic adaptor subunit [Methylacidiphilum caldifontis]|uniref:Efflux transporter periplasmic adaptor subunit n=2 Tax=Methylacidiphilum caldifontis TaxID=2795386 RepID=A0A4Y8PB31_9BACT|nr:efflux transporter periplasmic adaptor subunit [Methylacidiphilum caldifontis]